MLNQSVQIVKVHIQRIIPFVLCILPIMLILQNNLTSVNTSILHLKHVLRIERPHVVLLQEIWEPEEPLNFYGYTDRPIVKTRKGRDGGGVAIIHREDVRCREIHDFADPRLEAAWADVMVKSKRILVGSIYIPPGKLEDLKIFAEILGKVVQKYDKVIIGMDSNARNSLWDNTCLVNPPSGNSKKMGLLLESLVHTYGIEIHNSGAPTFIQGRACSAVDVTLSKGISSMGKITWSLDMKSLGTNHETIFLRVGLKEKRAPKSITNWKDFDWPLYRSDAQPWLSCHFNFEKILPSPKFQHIILMVKESSPANVSFL